MVKNNLTNNRFDQLFCHVKVSLQRIPYTRIYEEAKPFDDPNNRWLVPHCPVRVKIINVEQMTGTHILNPYLYTIEVQHFHYKWIIKRRHNHFHSLHQHLLLFRHSLRLPLPMKKHREIRKAIGPKNRRSVPKFPRRPEALILSEESLEERKVCSNNLLIIWRIVLNNELRHRIKICLPLFNCRNN